ncbi:hypothetical protein [Armatimonas sp.]|uniref:hypothetical protein n=1 Tax=Armatimonas sp. TaxID=1872638 RepID=UPI00286CE63B|nr:hypothetical protein [Armatimonas sp.]
MKHRFFRMLVNSPQVPYLGIVYHIAYCWVHLDKDGFFSSNQVLNRLKLIP